MPTSDDRKHFIIKHGLDAFEALPNFIWNTRAAKDKSPHRYSQVKLGDRWIGFAYTTSDLRERPLSLVTGFFECVREAEYRSIPQAGVPVSKGGDQAWLIEGKPWGDQPTEPVGVPPIDDLLGKSSWKNQAIVPVSSADFERVRDHALTHQLDRSKIPLLMREPTNEQEVLAVVIYGHLELGIKRIIRIRTAFPDLLVTIDGFPDEVHLELEVYSESFISHGHVTQMRERGFVGDGKPVAVLCWIDNARGKKDDIRDHVHQVFELRELIREGEKIVW